LVFSLIQTSVTTNVSAVLARAWSDVGLWSVAALWCVFVLALSSTVMLAAELLGRRWSWNAAVVEQVRGFCVVVMVVSALSYLGTMNPGPWGRTKMNASDWLGLVDWAVLIIAGALGVRLFIRARRRIRGDGAART